MRCAKETKQLPQSVKDRAGQRIGPVVSVHDASHDWHRSRACKLTGQGGVR
ncbi:hypothetical protein [Streptomyces sp. NPDC026589]|uniref:hypothetical protein n=1 Tax=Streptomyces sp. NPDC026589 TaxID=3155609 RepID=UPI0033E686AD